MALTFRGVGVLLTGIVFGLGLALGSTVWNTFTGRAKAAPAALDPTLESAALVAEVIDRVRREYVDSVDDKRIVEAAIRGIVADLDQHSTFLDAEEYEDIRISTTGNYTGVGLDVNLDGGKVTVVAPLEGAPAERAGILPGDVVSATHAGSGDDAGAHRPLRLSRRHRRVGRHRAIGPGCLQLEWLVGLGNRRRQRPIRKLDVRDVATLRPRLGRTQDVHGFAFLDAPFAKAHLRETP